MRTAGRLRDGISPEKCLDYPPENIGEFIQREGVAAPRTGCPSHFACGCAAGPKPIVPRDAVEAVRPYLTR